jgi:hypothetical protein
MPDADPPPATAIQLRLLEVVHVQPVPFAVTVNDPLPPVIARLRVAGVTVKEHDAAAWFTVKFWPAIASVADRAVVFGFAATLNPADPLLVPLAPLVIVIHETGDVADQAHPEGAVTVTVPVSPPAAIDALDGEIVGVHVTADCVTVNVFPPIVSVPLRDWFFVFAATEKLADPLPDPLAPAVTVIHVALLTVVHAQPVIALTVVDPEPPDAFTVCDEGEIVGVQGAPASLTVNAMPPIVRVPLRGVVVRFGSALKPTVPAPVPLLPDVTVNQLSLLVAVQSHPACVVIVTLPVPPRPATDCEIGEIAYEHVAAA